MSVVPNSPQEPDGFWRFAEAKAREARRARNTKRMVAGLAVAASAVGLYLFSGDIATLYGYYQAFHVVIRIIIFICLFLLVKHLAIAFTPLAPQPPEGHLQDAFICLSVGVMVFVSSGMYNNWRSGPQSALPANHPEAPLNDGGPPVVEPCSGQVDVRLLVENHWYNTGCYVQPMQTLIFTVTSHDIQVEGERYCGIEGCKVDAEVSGRLLCPDFKYMALVGRVNGGTCFLMPTRVTKISANNPGIGPGKLEVSFNNEIFTRVGGFPEHNAWRKIQGTMSYSGR